VTRLAGKVALITGGGTGIGRAIAMALRAKAPAVAVAGEAEKIRQKWARNPEGRRRGLRDGVRCDAELETLNAR